MRALILAGLLLPAFAVAQCPDYTSPVNTPAFTKPAKKSFRNFGNTILASVYKPWHMVHDQMVKSGDAAVVVGKFDYDAVLHKDLEGEYVHVYLAGTGMNNWQYIGRHTTNSDGKITANIGVRPVGEYQVRMVVEGDLSTVNGYLSVVEPGRQTVLFDIDGTLTINDFEAYADYVGVKTAASRIDVKKIESGYALWDKRKFLISEKEKKLWLKNLSSKKALELEEGMLSSDFLSAFPQILAF